VLICPPPQQQSLLRSCCHLFKACRLSAAGAWWLSCCRSCCLAFCQA
jgi:hypothetical protein